MTFDISKSIDACAAHYGSEADAMRDYLLLGQEKALELNNRGPIVFDENGQLDKKIKQAYSQYGFYIFENLLSDEELKDIQTDLTKMRERFPLDGSSKVNAAGQPGLGVDNKALTLLWAQPLRDPFGGTALANGRHQVKLFEPAAAEDAPKEVPFIMLGSLQFSEACLRIYAHPQLLKAAASVNGDDFAPFHEGIFFKDAGVGAAVSWHQDGDTHWDSPDFDEGSHGFNFMAQVYGSTAVNGVWVVPGTHKVGKVDIKAMIDEAGSERIVGAVPIVCNPGDVVICNRQLLHGSFANTGFETRVTVNFGFHRRSSVLDVMGAGIHSEAVPYDDNHIKARSKVIGYAIEARKQRYPQELAYVYKLHEETDQHFSWEPDTLASLKDYNLLDLSI